MIAYRIGSTCAPCRVHVIPMLKHAQRAAKVPIQLTYWRVYDTLRGGHGKYGEGGWRLGLCALLRVSSLACSLVRLVGGVQSNPSNLSL